MKILETTAFFEKKLVQLHIGRDDVGQKITRLLQKCYFDRFFGSA